MDLFFFLVRGNLKVDPFWDRRLSTGVRSFASFLGSMSSSGILRELTNLSWDLVEIVIREGAGEGLSHSYACIDTNPRADRAIHPSLESAASSFAHARKVASP